MTRAPRGRWLAAAAAGAASAVLAAGVGELAAALIAPESSPFAVIGGALIDLAPPWAKDAAISLFGTGDKVALLTGIAIVLLIVAAAAGVLEARFPPWGLVVIGACGVAGAVVSMTRAGAGPISWVPSAAAGIVGVVALRLLVGLLGRGAATATVAATVPVAAAGAAGDETDAPPAPAPAASATDSRVERRRFFAWTGGVAAAGVLALVAANLARTGTRVVTTVRDALRLPAPTGVPAEIPPGADLRIPGLAPVITPNDRFYRIDTALIVPQVDPADWSLRIRGMVDRELTLTWGDLLELPMHESATTLACVSNEVGGELIGNAVWLGYPIRELLSRAGPHADADMVLSRSIDGFTASTPLEALTDDRDAILAIGMNGEPLPVEHGFPVRMVVPGLYGYVSATKWVVELTVTRFDLERAYWTDRGWSERGPIKLQSRIDVPPRGQGLKAGDTVIAGVAWQQHVGVAGVEVQIDEGPWEQATLAPAISDDTWVQWSLPWTADIGGHVIRCRAISTTGEVQTSEHAPPAPDGATGWHERFVEVFE
ncbi:molybdopterin-dependent oxidoreductase [Microbacterium immunditiarum]|uniref:DMSO/TMAO reductase YedYZ molybdopterin-dependent catalytic subunit n=1 Tax=Microbacterium immunditiarum TaxID=337480 RepID=A0A7Y9GLW7_9MICO|nr:DMSO/TMAO reductase YedYZ molybdopterin-dependent catalytic subunit [Microbacterium immunditiarum]